MQESWKDKGLSILAVTSEGASDTEDFVESKGVRYAYAYDKGGKLGRYFGVQGIPDAVLIDADGVVLWQGHPGALEESLLEKATVGALRHPLWEWPDSARAARGALLKRDFRTALEQARKLTPAADGIDIAAEVQRMVTARVGAMKGARERGDFLGAQELAQTLKKELSGLPEAEEAARVAAEIAADKEAQTVIKGQQRIAKLRAKNLGKKKERIAAMEELGKLKSEFAGTYVVAEADALIRHIAALASGD